MHRRVPNSESKEISHDSLECASEFEMIIRNFHGHEQAVIGRCYYYIRDDGRRRGLCRMMVGYGKLYSAEFVDHESHGISDDDIDDAIRIASRSHETPGYYHISDHIDKKLRSLLEK